MNWYKIYKGGWQVTMRFDTLEEAEAKAAELGTGYSVEFVEPYVAPTPVDSLGMDITFCNSLINVFLEDNRIEGVTTAQGEVLMSKFSTTLSFAQVGAVASVKAHLETISVDDVFTQERKGKYLGMIADYQSQF